MLFCLFFFSSLVTFLLISYSRWLDEETVADLCLFGFLVEFCLSVFNVMYIYHTDSIFSLCCGSLVLEEYLCNISLVLIADEISCFFYCILSFALILCFYFLIEYFEYDSNGVSIILLSSLFSHCALWYFCVYDLFLFLFFWESISLISFFLIQHWSYRLPSYKAGIKVFVISQLGDIPLFCFVFLLTTRFETTDLTIILSNLVWLVFEQLLCCGILINFSYLVACLGIFAVFLKSAQFFFYPWLLDAMEAPVPISAQLHSSTLVIIGFYVYIRFQTLYILNPSISFLLLVFGFVTVILMSVMGFFQEDGKKLLACSTASQLGYVIIGLSLFYFEESLILLVFCCCNKAFTFIWFGAVMNRFNGISDFRIIGGFFVMSWLEHIGLLVSLSNFTIIPGVFSWHVKTLFIKSQLHFFPFYTILAFDILQVTWFFTTLYLLVLYTLLFVKVRSGARHIYQLTKISNASKQTDLDYIVFFNFFFIQKIFFFQISLYNYFSIYKLSTCFFTLLFFSFIILCDSNNMFNFIFADFSWVVDSCFFFNFWVIDFFSI